MKFFLYTPNFRPIASFNIAHFSIKMKTISVSINAPMTGWDGILVEIQYCSMSPGGTRHQSQDIPAGHDKHSSYMRKNYHTRAKLRDISPNQNGLWPHPSFLENHIADFATKVRDFATKVRDFATKERDFAKKVRMFILAGLLYIIWSFFSWDACSTTVQHGNWLKTYPEKTLSYHFHAEKALFKGPKSAI